jgi:hypothetical protein
MPRRAGKTMKALDAAQARIHEQADEIVRLSQERDGAEQAARRARGERDNAQMLYGQVSEECDRLRRTLDAAVRDHSALLDLVERTRLDEKLRDAMQDLVREAKEAGPALGGIARRLETTASRMETQAVRQESPVVKKDPPSWGEVSAPFCGTITGRFRSIVIDDGMDFVMAPTPPKDDPIRDYDRKLVDRLRADGKWDWEIIHRLLDELAVAKTICRRKQAEIAELRKPKHDPTKVERARQHLREMARCLRNRLKGPASCAAVTAYEREIEEVLS